MGTADISTNEKQMHKYGVVYLNSSNDLYVAKDMFRMLPLSSPTNLGL